MGCKPEVSVLLGAHAQAPHTQHKMYCSQKKSLSMSRQMLLGQLRECNWSYLVNTTPLEEPGMST